MVSLETGWLEDATMIDYIHKSLPDPSIHFLFILAHGEKLVTASHEGELRRNGRIILMLRDTFIFSFALAKLRNIFTGLKSGERDMT